MGRAPRRRHCASASTGAADGTRARGATGAVITDVFGILGTKKTAGFWDFRDSEGLGRSQERESIPVISESRCFLVRGIRNIHEGN
jgi:hypothetical protein